MHKTYLALVSGDWQLGTKRIDAPLATDERRQGERHVRVAAAGKESVSVFKPVQFFGKLATLMQVDIPTGRTHQIRVHAAYAEHPLLGDDKYGDRERNAELKGAGLEANISTCAIDRIRLAGLRRALSCERPLACGSRGGPRCDHAEEAARRCGTQAAARGLESLRESDSRRAAIRCTGGSAASR